MMKSCVTLSMEGKVKMMDEEEFIAQYPDEIQTEMREELQNIIKEDEKIERRINSNSNRGH